MNYAVSYLAALIFFLTIDFVWIKTVMRPIFERSVGMLMLETPRLSAAAAFYVLYVAGILYLAVVPALNAETIRIAVLNGAIVGFLAYGTYEATNLATLKGWTVEMLIIDVAWGATLSALTACAGYLAFRWMSG